MFPRALSGGPCCLCSLSSHGKKQGTAFLWEDRNFGGLVGQHHSPGGWRCKLHGDKMESEQGNVRQKTRKRLNIVRCHFPFICCSLQKLLPKWWISSSVSLAPWWGVGSGLILLSLPPLGTQTKVPAVGLTAALGQQPVLVEECHREDAFTRWL